MCVEGVMCLCAICVVEWGMVVGGVVFVIGCMDGDVCDVCGGV